MHFNARSLNANFKQIESYIHTLNTVFDVITLSESRSEATTLQQYNLPVKNVFQVYREHSRRGGQPYVQKQTVHKTKVNLHQ